MRGSEEFATAVRIGARSGTRLLVVHYLEQPRTHSSQPVRVGFVVSRAVGGAVERNLVRRRLRSAMAPEVEGLPEGGAVVVRARPQARGAGYDQLRDDLRGSLARARAKAEGGRDLAAAGSRGRR